MFKTIIKQINKIIQKRIQYKIDTLAEHLRTKLYSWVEDSKDNHNHKCMITKLNKISIHHIHSFNLITKESLKLSNIDIKKFNKYTQNELALITKHCLSLHKKYGYGACLHSDIHRLFHHLYGYGNNTEIQFDEFICRINKGEFDVAIQCIIETEGLIV